MVNQRHLYIVLCHAKNKLLNWKIIFILGIATLKGLYLILKWKVQRIKISTVLSEYYIQRVELGEVHPDLEDKIQLFTSWQKTRRFKFYYSRQLPHGIKYVC